MRIDLHAHTEHSDGTVTPTALVALARAVGLGALAVTDHDTTSGLAEARRAGEALGVEVIDGCEVSARIDDATVHVLAYGFDPEHAGFQAFLGRVRRTRDDRNAALHDRLRTLGVPVAREDVAAFVRGKIVARPHFARALVARGHVPDLRAAFHRYLADGAPAYVPQDAPPPVETVRAVVAAGGVPVVAHPKQIRLPDVDSYAVFLRGLADEGLAGIEVDHPSHDPEDRARFRALADRLGLVATGGSDFHGDAKPHIALGRGDGTIEVTEATWERLRARRR